MFRGRLHYFSVNFSPGDDSYSCGCSDCTCACPTAFIYTLGHGSDNAECDSLVLSDIHANLTALEAALEAAKGSWERVVCLGDVVGYGPDPNEVTSRIRDLGATTIRGNHDKAVTDLMATDDFNPVARAAVAVEPFATLQRKSGLARQPSARPAGSGRSGAGAWRVSG